MAENKKGFVLYADLISTVEQLPKDKQAELFMLILEYVNDRNPKPDDLLLKIAFEPIKVQLKRDLKKWEGRKEKRREAGKKGAEARWKDHDKGTLEMAKNGNRINGVAKMAVNVNVNDNVNGNVNDTVTDIKRVPVSGFSDEFLEIFNTYPKKDKKAMAASYWAGCNDEIKNTIRSHLPRFVKRLKDQGTEMRYIPNFVTYLVDKLWLDDIDDPISVSSDRMEFLKKHNLI